MALPDGRELHGQAVDISFSGICLHTNEAVTPPTTVQFEVWAVLPERETREIVMPGRVVWSTPVEGQVQIGATFDRDMDNRSWARLELLLQFLEGNLEDAARL
ncbi:PilZ domain protein [Enhygromyxa salina]|uniref:PilZ domain protein n=1 Tax=Enhygromyxa salina TaxID=215803 RepID=A0A2S9YL95_9BACT|nr:PilZ domain protein [Enhygromyxa salina]